MRNSLEVFIGALLFATGCSYKPRESLEDLHFRVLARKYLDFRVVIRHSDSIIARNQRLAII
jgi:hypothetical protein